MTRPVPARPIRLAAAARRCLLGLALASGSPAIADDAGPRVVVGVNIVNPQWQPRAEQDAVLDAVARSGTRVVRVPFVPPSGGSYDDIVDYVARATARGLGVILIVYPAFPEGAPTRPVMPGEPEIWPLPPLAAADPAVLAETYGPALRKLDARGLRLTAIEFGNEINWAAFNGDFPAPGRGAVFGYEDLETDPVGRRIAAGYRAFLTSLDALKRMRDGMTANRSTPILAGGFADYGPGGGTTSRPLDAVAVGASLRYLRVHGLDRLVDGYSIHTYPEAGLTPAERRARLTRDVVAECGETRGVGKPCWLTEWGVPVATACRRDGSDAPRAALVGEIRADLAEAVRDGRVRALVYFAWDGRDPHSLTRCGPLAAGGRAALAPVAP